LTHEESKPQIPKASCFREDKKVTNLCPLKQVLRFYDAAMQTAEVPCHDDHVREIYVRDQTKNDPEKKNIK